MSTPSPVETGGRRRFHLQRLLGEGTFGTVYLAEMESAGGFKRRVALKLLNANWEPDSDAGRRLRDEARLLGRLQHRHIVRVDDLIQVGGRWAFVMEYIAGADLEAVLAHAMNLGRPPPARAVLDVAIAVCVALQAAFDAPDADGRPLRVIHRDIKPSNVRLTADGDVKVLDFGVARADFAGREARTERVRYGSIGYMAPERLLGEPEEMAGDIYAIGVMMVELLTLRTFGRSELAPDAQAAQVAAARDAVVAALDCAPLADLIARTLDYTPDHRPSARDLELALRGLNAQLPGDDLAIFAGSFLPSIPAPDAEASVALVLDEGSGMTNAISSATIVLPLAGDADRAPTDPDAASVPPTPARSMTLAAAAFACVVAILLAVWASGAFTPAPDAGPPVAKQALPPAAQTLAASTPPGVVPAASDPPSAAEPAPAADTPEADTPARPAPPAGRPPNARTRPADAGVGAPTPIVPPAAISNPIQLDAPRVRAAKFLLEGGEGLKVRCGDVGNSGATSVLLRDFPSGDCAVEAAGTRATVRVENPGAVTCTLSEGALTCR